MRAKVNAKIGEATYQFEVEEQTDKETLNRIITLGNPPRKCDVCGNEEDNYLDSNKDKEGNIYIKMVCRACKANANLGTYKTGGFFWKQYEQWNKDYQPEAKKDEPEIDIDDVPFGK